MLDKKFIMMIGVAGSGKSTIANYICEHDFDEVEDEQTVIFSSDYVRGLLYGDENDQTHNKEIFEYMNKGAVEYLNKGKSVIYDATNLNADRRAKFLKWLSENVENFESVETIAIYVKCPETECVERQNRRGRKVHPKVISKQFRQLQAPTKEEGWDKIFTVEYL